ncbi:prolyl oligopeptidase family serine peptidase [Streptomyces sp. NPDC002994]|uniref:alpha/beta hydrolase family protein n=1 Tax=Streptomyces sp. NPDC002994 TaxID=3154441 RepID=UPI0033A96952
MPSVKGEQQWRDHAPQDGVWADVRAPAGPSLAERHPATVAWRDLMVDPGLSGLVPGRAGPTHIVLTAPTPKAPPAPTGTAPNNAGGASGGRAGRWLLPLRGVLATPLAWHPDRPLVAGLAVREHRAHPWVADYRARTVRLYGHVLAATALTGLGQAPPVAWCGSTRLALLVPRDGTDAGRNSGAAPARGAVPRPVVFEATGPGHISFAPGVEALKATAAARVAVLDVDEGEDPVPLPLSDPMLVRSLRATPTGEFLDVEYAEEAEDAYALAGRTTRLGLGVLGPPQPLSVAERPVRGPRDTVCTAGSPGRSVPAPRSGHSVLRLIPTCCADAPLAMFEGTAGGPPGPAVLWIQAHESGRPPATPPPSTLTRTGCPVAVLDLPVHWPSDAGLDMLHARITGPIGVAMETMARHYGERYSGDVVVAGHSFGATLALYTLAHVPGPVAAVVHSGCYNRTLTPTGFQQERRSYWQVPEIYQAFSALHFADLLGGPVLIVHGAADTNPATTPDQAVELYRAVVATGGHARLVLLPGEGHNPCHRETQSVLVEEHREWLARWSRVPEGREPCPQQPRDGGASVLPRPPAHGR